MLNFQKTTLHLGFTIRNPHAYSNKIAPQTAFQQRRLEYFQPHICNLAFEKLYLDNWRLVRQSYKTQTNSRGTNPVYDDHNFCLQKKLLDSYESALPHFQTSSFSLERKGPHRAVGNISMWRLYTVHRTARLASFIVLCC